MLICMSYATLDATLVAQMTEIWAEDIVSICTTSLVNVFDDQVQLAHFSVQEFLVLSEEDSKVEHHECQFTVIQGHRRLAEKSIDCLLAKTEPLLGADAMKMPWFLYASKHWHVHLGSAGGLDELDSDLQDKVTRLFLESTVYFNWIRGAESQPDNDEWSKVFVECEPPIHRAVALGFGHTIKDLIAQTQYADWRKVWDETDSLSMAAGQGHLDILQDLLEQNLSLDRKVAKSILKNIDHRKAGPDKLCKILETLWRQGLLGATDANDTLDEDVVLSAMQSEWSAVETLATFLSWRPQVTFPLTDNVIIIGMLWSKSPKGIVKLFLEKCHFRVPQAALARTTDRTIVYSTEALSFLALERPKELPINDSLLTVLAWEGDSAGMRSLLQAQKEKCRIPQFVFEYATENEDEAGMVPLLWEYREPDVKVDHSMLMNASSKRSHACETTKFLIERLDPDFSLDETVVLDIIRFSKDGVAMLRMLRSLPNVEVKVSENLVEEVCAHRDALAMLRVLETEEELGLPITESIVLAAAENSADACSVLGYLAQLCHDRLPITEEALIKAVDDPSQGDRALGALMKDTPDTMVTDYVFTSACKNKDAMRMLLDKHPEKAPVDRIVDTIVFHGGSAAGTLQLILERNMLDVDDALIEILATSFNLMNTLLLCKPDIAIPEKCLIESMIDPRTVRLIIAHQGSPFIVTEDLLIAAAKSLNGVESLEVLLNRQNSVPVTDRVIRTVCRMGAVKELHWLLNQKSESYFKEYWHEVWTSPDYGMGLKVSLLGYFMQRTNSTITDSMLSDLPCDPTQPDENLLETLLNPFCPTEGENDDSGDEEDSYELKVAKAILPQTERTAEIVVERCRQRAVQGFLQSTKIPITDNVLQAVERNCVTDRDELRTALKEMRD